MKVSMIAEFPLPIVMGGLELLCLKTCEALKSIGTPASLLNYHSREDDFDILHIFGNPPNIYELCYHAGKKKKIVISAVCGGRKSNWLKKITLSGMASCASLVHEQTNYQRIKYAFNVAHKIIVSVNEDRMFINNHYDIPLSKIVVIPNGVDDAFFESSSKLFIDQYGIKDFVLYVGNIVSRKNPLQLARALANTNYKGVFIGNEFAIESEYANSFREIVSSSPNLYWIKDLRYDDPLYASAYDAAKVFCLPSSDETQSLSALAAMAAKKSIILGDFPYSYFSPFENVIRCNPDDLNSIIRCVEQGFDKQHIQSQLPISYSWPNIAKEISKIYQDVINE